MSLSSDLLFIQAETSYRRERDRVAPRVARSRGRRRRPRRATPAGQHLDAGPA